MSQQFNHDYFYDFSYAERKSDIDFYVDIAKQYGSKGILEVGCGTGRVLCEIAKEGINIDGIDPNSNRIKLCQRYMKPILKENPKLKSDMSVNTIQTYKTSKKYSLITMPFRVFQHLLTPQAQEDTVRQIKNYLVPGGVFVFDIFNPNIKMLANDKFKHEFGAEQYVTDTGIKFIRKDRIAARDYFNQLQFAEEIFEFELNGKPYKIVDKYTTRYSFKNEIELLLKYTGFQLLATYGDFNKNPFGQTKYPGDLIFVAQKTR